MVPFENEIEGAPAPGVNVGAPQPEVEAVAGLAATIAPDDGAPAHVVVGDGVAATCSPLGSVSVNLTPVRRALFGLVSVKVNVDVALTAMGFGEKALPIVSGWAVPQPVNAMSS